MLGVLRIARLLNRAPSVRIRPMSKADRLFWEKLHESRQRGAITKD